MRAVRLHELGGPDALQIETVPEPTPGRGEVLVRLRFAALNRRDVFITRGLYPGIVLPSTLGADGVGVRADTGASVIIDPMLHWGDNPRVWAEGAQVLGVPRDGTFAEAIAIPAENVYPAPTHLSADQAAALPLAGLTAYRALITRGRAMMGETVLVTGIGGGVQSFVMQFALALGATVIATSSSDTKLANARALGAQHTVNYRTNPEWYKDLRKLPPIDVAVDSAGGEAFSRAIDAVRPGGRVVTYGGTTTTSNVRLFSVFWKHLDILGSSMGSPSDFSEMLAFVSKHQLRPVIDQIFPMTRIDDAFKHLEASEQCGKIVIDLSI
ncbi:MAG: zinc-binding dehydrogenase [Vulcanimicrobiaceae bacterium]